MCILLCSASLFLQNKVFRVMETSYCTVKINLLIRIYKISNLSWRYVNSRIQNKSLIHFTNFLIALNSSFLPFPEGGPRCYFPLVFFWLMQISLAKEKQNVDFLLHITNTIIIPHVNIHQLNRIWLADMVT